MRTYFSIRNELLWFSRHAPFSARLRLWMKNLRRLTPKFSMSSGQSAWIKRLIWAVEDYVRAWLGRGSRLEYLAARRAILDYVHRRFGDCPDEVRTWSKAWAARQANG